MIRQPGLLARWRNRRTMPHRPWALFCYHKGGTMLLVGAFREIAQEFGLRFRTVLGRPDTIPDADIILFAHSLVEPDELPRGFRGVHLVRDPRDVVVSGYLYHRRTDEAWCTNVSDDVSEPIRHPRVPYSQEHRPEAWKRAYLESLGGRSYQSHLLELPRDEGLAFELDHYGRWTLESMERWPGGDPRILELRFETIMADFDGAFGSLFRHLELEGEDLAAAMELAQRHDLSRRSDEELSEDPHVSSRNTTRWKGYFTDDLRRLFKERHGHLLVSLGYEADLDW